MALSDRGIKLLDIFTKMTIAIFVAVFGWRFESSLEDRRRQQDKALEEARAAQLKTNERSRQLQATAELLSRHKELDVDLGKELFGTLMRDYIQKDSPEPTRESLKKHMLLLRLVALNFLDTPVHLKPLFEHIDSQLAHPEDKQQLREIGRDIARRQVYRLINEVNVPGSSISTMIPPIYEEYVVKSGQTFTNGGTGVSVDVISVGPEGARVRMNSNAMPKSVGPFTVSHFDAPLVDNVRVVDWRVALILLEAKEEECKLIFVAFPAHLAYDRFDVKNLSSPFIEPDPYVEPTAPDTTATKEAPARS